MSKENSQTILNNIKQVLYGSMDGIEAQAQLLKDINRYAKAYYREQKIADDISPEARQKLLDYTRQANSKRSER